MSQDLFISVIIPTFNREWCLQRAISSVLNQSYKNYELIIIDDHSADNTEELVKSYVDKIIYKRLEKNYGVNYARNRGYEIACGDILVFLDSDDELLPKALETIANDFTQHNDASLIAYNCIDSITGFKTSNIKSGFGNYKDFVCGKIHGELFQIIKSDVMKNYKFPEFVNGVESLFWFEIWKNYKVYISEDALRIYHTETIGSIMKSASRNKLLTFGLAREKLIQEFGNDIKNACLNSYLKFLYITGLELAMGGLKNKGIDYLKNSYSISKNMKTISIIIFTRIFGSEILRLMFSIKKSYLNIIRSHFKRNKKSVQFFHLTYVIGSLGAGGAEKLVCDLAVGLDKDKFKVSIIALGSYSDKEFERKRVESLRQNGVEVIIIPKKAHGNRFRSIINLRKILKRDRPNIIHAHLFTGMFYAKMASWGMKIPIIATYHSTSGFGIKDKIFAIIFAKHFKKIVAVSKGVKDFIQSYFKIPSSKITVIYNGIETKRFMIDKKSYSGNDNVIFASVGRLVEQKGYLTLIKALIYLKSQKGVNNFEFKIAGDGPLKKDLLQMVHDNSLENNIEFVGNITNVPEFLAESDIFVMPSLYEGFGIALVEGMASGKPVIVSNLDVFKEVLDLKNVNLDSNYLVTNYGLIFKTNDLQSLADSIKWMLEHKEKWSEFSQNARNRAKEFDISKTISEHEKIYEEILR